jgi:hypothetical protein
VTQIVLNPYRPESGDRRPLRKLARNYRALYHQYQNIGELTAATAFGRWIALESGVPGSKSVHDVDWYDLMHERYAQQEGLHIVTGSMNHGLERDVLDMMDLVVYVPQFDDVPFLAPATAAAIVLDRIFVATANRSGVLG